MAVAAAPLLVVESAMSVLDEKLDLSLVCWKLANPEDGAGPSPPEIELREREYRKFLALRLAHPGAPIVPCKLVDELWHRHILDTAAYRADCEAIFGSFLDHYPYFGMRSKQDAEDLSDAYAETLELYRDAFGEPPPGTWISTPEDASRCRTGCKPVRCR